MNKGWGIDHIMKQGPNRERLPRKVGLSDPARHYGHTITVISKKDLLLVCAMRSSQWWMTIKHSEFVSEELDGEYLIEYTSVRNSGRSSKNIWTYLWKSFTHE